MPHKFNTSRRHKFAKKKYRVTNWCGYNESLRNRGDLTVWITGDARKHWAAPRRRSRGGQPRYSDLAITMCLTLGMVYRLPLRQTQGLIRSISKLMLLEISVPDFSTLSRRGRGLSLPARPKIKIIPTVIDQNPCAHLRMPRDMIFHGWSMRLFQAWQHSATMSS